jgi:hypothetical protein
MRALCDWFVGEGSRALVDGEDDRFLLELRRWLCGTASPAEGAELHARLLAKVALLLPDLAREAKAGPEALAHAERVAATRGLHPADGLVGSSAPELAEQTRLAVQLQQLGPTLYWELLRTLFGDDRRLDFDTTWAWFARYAEAGPGRAFFAAHQTELQQLLRAGGAGLVGGVVQRIRRRKARTAARGGIVAKPKIAIADLIAGFAAALLDHLNQNLETASWMGGLFVLSERAGKNVVCWAQGERFELSSVAAQLLMEVGDTRQLYADDRHLKQLEEQFPPIRGLIRRGSVQGNHRTTVRGVGLVGRVADLVSPKA